MAVWLAALAVCLAASLTGCQLAPRAGACFSAMCVQEGGGQGRQGARDRPKNGGHQHGGFLGNRPGGPALPLSCSLKPPLEQRDAGTQPSVLTAPFLP